MFTNLWAAKVNEFTIVLPHRYDMLESTWQEEPDKRPSFSDIVHTLSDGVGIDSIVNNVSPTKGTTDYVDVLAQWCRI